MTPVTQEALAMLTAQRLRHLGETWDARCAHLQRDVAETRQRARVWCEDLGVKILPRTLPPTTDAASRVEAATITPGIGMNTIYKTDKQRQIRDAVELLTRTDGQATVDTIRDHTGLSRQAIGATVGRCEGFAREGDVVTLAGESAPKVEKAPFFPGEAPEVTKRLQGVLHDPGPDYVPTWATQITKAVDRHVRFALQHIEDRDWDSAIYHLQRQKAEEAAA